MPPPSLILKRVQNSWLFFGRAQRRVCGATHREGPAFVTTWISAGLGLLGGVLFPALVESDVLVGTLHYGSVLCASATMGYKHRTVDHDAVLKSMKAPNFMLKIIPHVDGTPRICELVRYYLEDITLKEAWTGPAALGLFPHALADVARLPVREVVSALHFKADLTLGLGTVAFDYMAK